MKKTIFTGLIVLYCLAPLLAQEGIKIAKLKYNGGGDWYANKTALPNLIEFCNQNLNMRLAPEEEIVEVGSLSYSPILMYI
jgi:oligoribonuclease NrnB/cAMP/cGMP phosphodiesterase (DHH superfamily)